MKKILIIAAIIFAFQLNAKAQNWPTGVTYISSIANDSTTVKGDLATGKVIDDLSWASSSSNACFTGLQFKQYMGNHVFYGTTIKPGTIIRVKLTPDNEAEEVNLYGYMMGEGEMQMVPNLTQCITCEADYKRDRPMKFKPLSHVSDIEFRNPSKNTYTIIIGVAAPKGVTDRKFSIMVKTVS